MSSYDLIWKLILILLAQKDTSMKDEKSKEENN